MIDRMPAHLEAVTGSIMVLAPVWINWMHVATDVGAAVTAVSGAILGIHSVWRMIRRKNKRLGDQ